MNFNFLQIIPTILGMYWRNKVKMKIFSIGIIFYLLFSVSTSVIAAPPEEELQHYLHNLGWTKENLDSYLTAYDLSVNEFDTMEELVEVLGTPINEYNVQNVLDKHGLLMEDLDDLLSQFGESTEDYSFIEELNKAVSFYLEHNHAMTGMIDFLSYIDMTEDEITQLFNHIGKIEKGPLLSRLQGINFRIDSLGSLEEGSNLSLNQQKELLAIFEDVVSIYQLNPTYEVIPVVENSNETISYNKITDIEAIRGKSVHVSLYTRQGELLADMSLTADMLTSDFVLQASEQLAQVGHLSAEMNSFMYGDMLPDTASNYLINLLCGLLLLLIGIYFYYLASNNREQI